MPEFYLDMRKPDNNGERPTFIKTHNSRYKKDLWSYYKLVDASGAFCLCTYCAKSDIPNGKICPMHDKFMRVTEEMKIAGPVFACGEFEESEEIYNYLNDYYDNGVLSSEMIGARIPEVREKIKEQWKAQKELWANEQS